MTGGPGHGGGRWAPPRPSRRRGTVLVGLTVALTLVASLALPGVVSASSGLRLKFESRGRFIGVAVDARKLADPAYAAILNREFSSVTPETELEWDSVEPLRGQFVFTRADQIVAHAAANRMQVRGRALVSPSSIHSAWFGNLSGADALASALRTHVTGVLTHHRGQIASWNVVTEAFTETGALRRSSFERYLGASFIEQAFRLARAADPSAKLCYNDFGIEDIDRPKAMAVHRMIQDFKARGVPIDCVGLESHFSSASPVPANFARTLATFAALGVDVQLTELDVAGSGAAQADSYRRAVTACFVVPRCTGITIWGVRDSDSWRSADTPVLFDAAGNPKPAYYAVLSA